MQLAAGLCRHWLIILHCCASRRSHGACGVRVWVLGSGAGAAQPTLLQRGDGSTGWNRAEKDVCERMRRRASKNFRRVSDTGNPTHRSFPRAGVDGVSFSSLLLSVCLPFPPQVLIAQEKPNTHQTATADLVFPFHTPPTRVTFACALIFIQSHLFQMSTQLCK